MARLIGHTAQKRIIERGLASGKFGHAHLFVGPDGIGRRVFAYEIVRGLLCCESGSQPIFGGCGLCSSCFLLLANTHPDFHEFSKPEDDQEFKLELMQKVIQAFSLQPSLGDRKALIVCDVDLMNEQSANCFLKALEEPPPNVWIALLCENPEVLLPTIRSRCQVIRFSPLTENEIISCLSLSSISSELHRSLARMAEGNPGRAYAIGDTDFWSFWSLFWVKLANSKFSGGEWADQLRGWIEISGPNGASQRSATRIVFNLISSMISDCFRINEGLKACCFSSDDEPFLRIIAKRLGPVGLQLFFEAIFQANIRIKKKIQISLILDTFSEQIDSIVTVHRKSTAAAG